MKIRAFQAGDEAAQAALYNQVAAQLPKFKPATSEEVRRRTRAQNFDPHSRFYAEENGQVVGYATFQDNGRVSFPWCLPGHEAAAEPLFKSVLDTMRRRGRKTAFAAYRGDWPHVKDFFLGHGFRQSREILNFLLDLTDMPTPPARPSSTLQPVRPEDLPAVYELARPVSRLRTAADFERYLLHNPYFPAEAALALRGRGDSEISALCILVENPTYSNPRVIDANMPCFRLGAFGSEGMTTKRLHGMFSFVAKPDRDLTVQGLDLLGQVVLRLDDPEISWLAAQVPSDAPAELVRFYQRIFRKQGSFPIYECELK